MSTPSNHFMRRAVALARANIAAGGRPYGAVLVRGDEVIAEAVNENHLEHDPTAHAELLAIRRAGKKLGTTSLKDCVVYASGQPCPMCLAAMHLSGIPRAYFAYSNEDGAPYGLTTAHIYEQMTRPFDQQRVELRPHRPEGESGLYAEFVGREGAKR